MPGLFQNYPGNLAPTGQELMPLDLPAPSNLNVLPETVVMSAMQVAGSGPVTMRNLLKGGDFTSNPWVRGTTFTGISSTLTYTADRFGALGGASSSISVSKQAVATGAIPGEGFGQALQFGRAAANANTALIQIGQALETLDSIQAQTDQVTLSFWAQAGANFSAVGNFLNLYAFTGTGTDQSLAAMLAGTWTGSSARQLSTVANGNISFGVNAVSLGNPGVGQASVGNPSTGLGYGPVLTPVTGVNITSSWAKYQVTFSVAQTATQLGIAFGYTPVGTAGANDWFQIAGVQLECVAANMPVATPFEHRPQSVEAVLCQRYAYSWSEPAANVPVSAIGLATGAATQKIILPLPAFMRAAPTMTIPSAGSWRLNIAGTPTAVTLAAATSSVSAGVLTGGATNTAGQVLLLEGNGGNGLIVASAEL